MATLAVHVSPRSAQSALVGWEAGSRVAPTASDGAPATGKRAPATGNAARAAGGMAGAAGNRAPVTGNGAPACHTGTARTLTVRLTAAPTEGKANEALIKLLAHELGMPKTSIRIKRGAGSRYKILELDTEQAALDALLATIIGN